MTKVNKKCQNLDGISSDFHLINQFTNNMDDTALETTIGYTYSNKNILHEVLGNGPSLSFEQRRLQMLGECILKLVLAEHLLVSLPRLDALRIDAICDNLVHKVEYFNFITDHLNFYSLFDHFTANCARSYLLAVIGSIYLDCNYDTSRIKKLAVRWFNPMCVEEIGNCKMNYDYMQSQTRWGHNDAEPRWDNGANSGRERANSGRERANSGRERAWAVDQLSYFGSNNDKWKNDFACNFDKSTWKVNKTDELNSNIHRPWADKSDKGQNQKFMHYPLFDVSNDLSSNNSMLYMADDYFFDENSFLNFDLPHQFNEHQSKYNHHQQQQLNPKASSNGNKNVLYSTVAARATPEVPEGKYRNTSIQSPDDPLFRKRRYKETPHRLAQLLFSFILHEDEQVIDVLSKGLDPNVHNPAGGKGETPITLLLRHYYTAQSKKKKNIIKNRLSLLHKYGARWDFPDGSGHTPRDLVKLWELDIDLDTL